MQGRFVGRTIESAALDDGLAEARAGSGRLYLVAGEPGIGKSRLADEFSARVRAAGSPVVWGRCWEAGGAPAYWPWTEALTAAVQRQDLDALRRGLGAAAADLHQIVPAIGDGLTIDANLGPDTARFRLFDAVVRLCRLVTADGPLVLVLDDVHVADSSSLLLLQYMAGQLADVRIIVLATYRDVELTSDHPFSSVLEWLLRERSTRRIRLRGLDEDAVAQLIESTTGLAASRRLAVRVREHTDGNPLYVAEAVRLLDTEGALEREGDVDRFLFPRDMRETVLRRVAHLSEPCHRVLATAAVLGREFPLDLLTAMVDHDTDAIAVLDEAVKASVIVDVQGNVGRLRFSHAVISEALYGDIAPLERRQLHYDAARILQALRSGDLDPHLADIARHSCASLPVGDADEATDYARRAAELAVRQLAYEEGARLFRMALIAHSGSERAGTSERTELLLSLGDAQVKGGDTDASKVTFLAAADMARSADDTERFARAALGYSGRFVWQRAGTDGRIVPLLREALARLDESDSIVRTRLLARLAGALRDEPTLEQRDQLSAEAVAMAYRIGDASTSAYALTARATAIWGPDSADEQVLLGDEIARFAEEANEPDRLADALWIRFEALLAVGRGDEVRAVADMHERLSEEVRQPSHLWYSGVMQSIVLLLEGQIARAEVVIEATHAAGEKAQSWDAEASYLMALTLLRREEGRLGEVERALVDALSQYPGYRLFRCLLCLVYVETGRVDDAEAIVRDIVTRGDDALPRDNGWLFGMTILADVVARLDDEGLASTVYEAMLPYARLVGSGAGEVVTGSVHRPLGLMLAILGRYDEACTHFDAAQDLHRRTGADLWVVRTDVDHAWTLLRRGTDADRQAATVLLQRSLDASLRLGMSAVANTVARMTPAMAARKSADARAGGLTPRELQVAALVAEGRSNRDIAQEFVLSERTIESHVQNILTKLAFSSRVEIAAWAIRNGIAADR